MIDGRIIRGQIFEDHSETFITNGQPLIDLRCLGMILSDLDLDCCITHSKLSEHLAHESVDQLKFT